MAHGSSNRVTPPGELGYSPREFDKRKAGMMAEHEHGSMDITEQERTFEGFVRWTTRTVVAVAVLLVLLAFFNA